MAKEPEDPALEEIELMRKKALEKELAEIREQSPVKKGKKSVKEADHGVVEASLRDKGVAKQEAFTKTDKKTAGVSAGYVAEETATGQTFLLKQFFKSEGDCQDTQALKDRNDGVQEFIASAMYQFLLYDRAPKEQLVTPDADNPKSLYVRSKFFKNVKQLSEFSGAPSSLINPKNSKLQQIKGFEKVIAACHVLGEFDYHAGNMMVREDGIVTKIDHGRSFWGFHKDFASMVTSTDKDFNDHGYNEAIKAGNLTFDVKEYSLALNQMVAQFSEEQIDKIVDRRVAELEAAGFDPQGLVAMPRFSDKDDRTIAINDFDDLRRVYKEITKENLQNMREIAKQVEIVAKFSNVSPKFKKGGWLKAFAKSNEKDPIKYAIKNKIKIDGLDAKQYLLAKHIEEYLQEKDQKKKLELQKKYEKVANELKLDSKIAKQYVLGNIIEQYLETQSPLEKKRLEEKYKNAAKELGIDEKNGKPYVLEKIIEQYLETQDPLEKKRLEEKYKAVQGLGEERATELLTMESNLGQFLNNPKAVELIVNSKDLKGKLGDIDYTKCDLPLIAKCKEIHEKTSKGRDYDSFSTVQKVKVAFATVVPVIGNVIAYYTIKSQNQAAKAKLAPEISASFSGIKDDLEKLTKEPTESRLKNLAKQIGIKMSSYKATASASTTSVVRTGGEDRSR